MSWSFRIATVFGIGVYLHWTFVLFLVYIGYSAYHATHNLNHAVAAIVYVSAMFLCVVLHEFGHALTARRFGVGTQDITLLPIGGIARLDRIPEEPWHEFWIAIAGPAVNVVIAAVLLVVHLVSGSGRPLSLEWSGDEIVTSLMVVNVLLFAFNLIPAFPMDGGRILRALLAMVMPRVTATNVAARVGQAIAIGFGLLSILSQNWILLFITIFVFLGAQGEAQFVAWRETFRNVSVGQAMATQFRSLSPTDSLQVAIDELIAGHQQDFPVVESGRLVGLLRRRDLVAGLGRAGPSLPVGEAMSRDCPATTVYAPLNDVIDTMRAADCQSVPVIHEDRVVGLLTSENIGDWMIIQAALRDRTRKA
jgi:Zn-dependent protease/CBS domain-containing protein